jgi:protein-disulfide isomerase
MRGFRIGVIAGALALGLAASVPASAEEPALTPGQKEAVEGIVHDYLLAHPEVLVKALESYQARQKAEEEARKRQALIAHRRLLVDDPADPVLGNAGGDVTVVEFFDYRCPYCKRVAGGLMETVRADGNVRLVMKEFPILGPESVVAARAALAAEQQGKYEDLHNALMGLKGEMSEATIMKTAESVGLDVVQLKRDMKAEAIDQALRSNYELADALGIGGTPAFVVGDTLVPGAMSMDDLKALIAKARAG